MKSGCDSQNSPNLLGARAHTSGILPDKTPFTWSLITSQIYTQSDIIVACPRWVMPGLQFKFQMNGQTNAQVSLLLHVHMHAYHNVRIIQQFTFRSAARPWERGLWAERSICHQNTIGIGYLNNISIYHLTFWILEVSFSQWNARQETSFLHLNMH